METTGELDTVHVWLLCKHPDVWAMWIKDKSDRNATDYIKAEHPHLWVQWRMKQ